MNNIILVQIETEIENADVYVDYDDIINELKDNINITRDDILNAITKYSKGFKNRCFYCKIDMGESNPRQLCCKTYCPDEYN